MTLGRATNNVAEYRGLLLGLERAARARGDRGRRRQRLRADRPPGRRRLQGQARRPEAAARRGAAPRWRLRALVDPPGAAGARTPTRTRSSTGRWTGRTSEPARPAPAGGTDYAAYLLIDDLLRAPAAAHAGRARRAAVHRRPPGLRALVQADPARADAARDELAAGAPARRRAAPASAWSRSSGCCSTSSRCSRRWAPRASSSSATRWRPLGLPVAPVPRRSSGSRATADLARRRRAAGAVAV